VSPLPVDTCAGVNEHVLNGGIVEHNSVHCAWKSCSITQPASIKIVCGGLSGLDCRSIGIIVQRKIELGGEL
jgi:hypothetical protein